MGRQPTQAEVIDDLLARYEREITEAFRAAIADLGQNADLSAVIDALRRNDIEAALEALNLDPAAYSGLLDAVQRAYSESGAANAAIANLATGPSLAIRFDVRNPRAERWLRDYSSTLVTRILDDQRQAIRAALVDGMARGQNPRSTALEIVGRINRATGAREGGILGLTAAQERYLATARAELASGDTEALRNYLTRQRRDKRFDRSVAKAIREGTPLPAEIQRKAVVAYQRRLLQLRGETIGRTEALTSLHAAQQEAYLQAVEKGQIEEADVRRVWRSARDLRVRHTHSALDGDPAGLREPFRSPSGARLMYPGDTSLGAPASETINCRCTVIVRLDWRGNLRR